MVIKITTEKVVDRGRAMRKIIALEGILVKDSLPEEYLEGRPHFYKRPIHDAINGESGNGSNFWLEVEGVHTEPEFQSYLNIVRDASNRLHEINQKVKALKATWQGQEIFVI